MSEQKIGPEDCTSPKGKGGRRNLFLVVSLPRRSLQALKRVASGSGERTLNNEKTLSDAEEGSKPSHKNIQAGNNTQSPKSKGMDEPKPKPTTTDSIPQSNELARTHTTSGSQVKAELIDNTIQCERGEAKVAATGAESEASEVATRRNDKPNSSTNGAATPTVRECDHEKNCSSLYKQIETKGKEDNWESIVRFLDTGYWPGSRIADAVSPKEQAMTWVTSYGDESRSVVRYSQLPLHLTIVGGAPFTVIGRLIGLYPDSVRCTDDKGRLPIHLALRHGALGDTLNYLLLEFPESVGMKDGEGKTPIDYGLREQESVRTALVELCIEKSRNMLTPEAAEGEGKWPYSPRRSILRAQEKWVHFVKTKRNSRETRKSMKTEPTGPEPTNASTHLSTEATSEVHTLATTTRSQKWRRARTKLKAVVALLWLSQSRTAKKRNAASPTSQASRSMTDRESAPQQEGNKALARNELTVTTGSEESSDSVKTLVLSNRRQRSGTTLTDSVNRNAPNATSLNDVNHETRASPPLDKSYKLTKTQSIISATDSPNEMVHLTPAESTIKPDDRTPRDKARASSNARKNRKHDLSRRGSKSPKMWKQVFTSKLAKQRDERANPVFRIHVSDNTGQATRVIDIDMDRSKSATSVPTSESPKSPDGVKLRMESTKANKLQVAASVEESAKASPGGFAQVDTNTAKAGGLLRSARAPSSSQSRRHRPGRKMFQAIMVAMSFKRKRERKALVADHRNPMEKMKPGIPEKKAPGSESPLTVVKSQRSQLAKAVSKKLTERDVPPPSVKVVHNTGNSDEQADSKQDVAVTSEDSMELMEDAGKLSKSSSGTERSESNPLDKRQGVAKPEDMPEFPKLALSVERQSGVIEMSVVPESKQRRLVKITSQQPTGVPTSSIIEISGGSESNLSEPKHKLRGWGRKESKDTIKGSTSFQSQGSSTMSKLWKDMIQPVSTQSRTATPAVDVSIDAESGAIEVAPAIAKGREMYDTSVPSVIDAADPTANGNASPPDPSPLKTRTRSLTNAALPTVLAPSVSAVNRDAKPSLKINPLSSPTEVPLKSAAQQGLPKQNGRKVKAWKGRFLPPAMPFRNSGTSDSKVPPAPRASFGSKSWMSTDLGVVQNLSKRNIWSQLPKVVESIDSESGAIELTTASPRNNSRMNFGGNSTKQSQRLRKDHSLSQLPRKDHSLSQPYSMSSSSRRSFQSLESFAARVASLERKNEMQYRSRSMQVSSPSRGSVNSFGEQATASSPSFALERKDPSPLRSCLRTSSYPARSLDSSTQKIVSQSTATDLGMSRSVDSEKSEEYLRLIKKIVTAKSSEEEVVEGGKVGGTKNVKRSTSSSLLRKNSSRQLNRAGRSSSFARFLRNRSLLSKEPSWNSSGPSSCSSTSSSDQSAPYVVEFHP